MTFNIIERAKEREIAIQFKSISFSADNLKNTEKKPTGLGLVKSSVHRFVCNLCCFLLGQEAEIKKIGPDSQENLRVIWRLFYLWAQIWKFSFLSFSQSTVDCLRYRGVLRICRSLFKRLLFLHYQVILATTSDFPTGFVFVLCSMVWE